MKGNFKATTAIALLDSTKVAAPAVKKFGDAVAEQFTEIARSERMNAGRAILIGMALPVLKSSLPKGTFTAWMKSNLTQGKIWSETTAIKNASFYTRLAYAFLEEVKPAANEVLAITDGDAIRGTPGNDANAAKLLRRMAAFIGERSLNELLEDYGIKSGGGSGGAGNAIDVGGAKEDPLLADTAAHLLGLREILLKPDTLKRFTAKQLDDIERQLAALPEEFRKLKAKLKG